MNLTRALTPRHSALRPVAVAFAAIPILAACAGDDAEDAATSTSTSAVATDATDATVAPAEPLEARVLIGGAAASFMDHFVAIRSGFCEEEGLDLEVLPFVPNSAQVTGAVVGGDADIGVGAASAVFELREQGRDPIFFAHGPSAPTAVVAVTDEFAAEMEESGVTPASSALERLQALEGQTIATTSAGGGPEVFIRALFSANDVESSIDQFIAIGDLTGLVGALREGRVDALIQGPVASLIPEAEGFGVTWLGPSDYAELGELGASYSAVAFTTESFYEESPETIDAYYRCLERAHELIASDPDQARDLFGQEVPETDPLVLELSVDILAPLFSDGPAFTEEGFLATLESHNLSAATPSTAAFDDSVITPTP